MLAERALLAGLGGTCHSPIAALTTHAGEELLLRAALFSPDGAERIEESLRFPAEDMDAPRQLANCLLTMAPPAIAAHFVKPQADLR